MNKDKTEDQQSQEWIKACREISRLTRIKLEETVDNSYGLVIDKAHPLFAKIGIYDHSEYFPARHLYKIGKEFIHFSSRQLIQTKNIIQILKERERILSTGEQLSLFHD